MKNSSIIPYFYNGKLNIINYINQLRTILEDIIILDWIKKQFELEIEQRDFVIKFKKFTSKEMFDFNQSIFEKDNVGQWYNYIYTLVSKENINIKNILFRLENNLLLANDYNFKKSLFIFWRLIANNLDSKTTIKMSFKVLFKLKNKDQVDNLSLNNENFIKEDKDVFIIRTISPIQVITNKDFDKLYVITL